MMECIQCINTSKNPAITFHNGLCEVCKLYKDRFKPEILKEELNHVKSFGKAMVGISGGKDSTATLYTALKLGFNVSTFTFDLGYYPKHIFPRAEQVAFNLGVKHEVIDIRKHIRDIDHQCYDLTFKLYQEGDSEQFLNWYEEGRKHYSAKSEVILPFVRSCQLCRRTVIRSYYEEAITRGVQVVILGMNEWAGLSGNQFSGIRRLKPDHRPEIYIVHLPFLLQHKLNDTIEILIKLGWKKPNGESLIETNGNSCLFALATQEKARELLGFHPDTTRLAREVTAGFITKEQAKRALEKRHVSQLTIEEVIKMKG